MSQQSILIDTGVVVSGLNKERLAQAGQKGSPLKDWTGRKLMEVQGLPLRLNGSACVQEQLAEEKSSVDVMVADTSTADFIIGRDFL